MTLNFPKSIYTAAEATAASISPANASPSDGDTGTIGSYGFTFDDDRIAVGDGRWVLNDGSTYSLASGATYTWDLYKWKASNIPDSSDVVQTTNTPSNGEFLKWDNGAAVWAADNDTTYSNFTGDSGSGGAAGLVPAPTAGDAAAGKYLDSDGTWSTPPDTYATYSNFTGDSGSCGAAGLVPAPASGDAAAGKYLDSDGTWSTPPDTDTTYSNATTSADGLMSSSDKSKLNGIETSADVTDAINVAAAGAVMESDTSTASMNFVVDEDNMSSNSSTKVPTQQSVKAYVDNNSGVPASGGSFTGTVDFDSNVTQEVQTVSALNIDCSTGNYFTKTINANSTFTVSSVPSSGTAYSFTLELTHTSGTVTWWNNLEWPGGTAPTLTAGKTHLFVFVTDDGGTRWRGASLVDYTN